MEAVTLPGRLAILLGAGSRAALRRWGWGWNDSFQGHAKSGVGSPWGAPERPSEKTTLASPPFPHLSAGVGETRWAALPDASSVALRQPGSSQLTLGSFSHRPNSHMPLTRPVASSWVPKPGLATIHSH